MQTDLDEALARYSEISERLVDDFWQELTAAFNSALKHPEGNHFDILAPSLRRVNLKQFPYNFLYLVETNRVRIQVVRHNSRLPGYGTRRAKGR